jgi:hypothetical protein
VPRGRRGSSPWPKVFDLLRRRQGLLWRLDRRPMRPLLSPDGGRMCLLCAEGEDAPSRMRAVDPCFCARRVCSARPAANGPAHGPPSLKRMVPSQRAGRSAICSRLQLRAPSESESIPDHDTIPPPVPTRSHRSAAAVTGSARGSSELVKAHAHQRVIVDPAVATLASGPGFQRAGRACNPSRAPA